MLCHQDRDPAPNLFPEWAVAHPGKKRKKKIVTRPMLTGEKVMYCAAGEKKKEPLAYEFEMNMAAWATRLIPFGMQEGYIHTQREQICRCGTGVHRYGWSPLGDPSQFKKGF